METIEQKHQTINLAEFLSVCIYLAEESGKIIREVHKSGDIGTQNKDFDQGPVTIADLRVQKNIEENLKALYPTLMIQGEEAPETYSQYEATIKPEDIPKDFMKTEMLNQSHKDRMQFLESVSETFKDETYEFPFETFSTENAIVWIDPLDGTNDFVKGNLSAVTVLIGLSLNGVSKLGIVHNPFSEADPKLGKTTVGSLEHGVYELDYNENFTKTELLARSPRLLQPFNPEEQPSEDHVITVAASLSHFSQQLKEFIERSQPVEIKRIGGAGHKCCSVATGVVDSYMHPTWGLSYWDLCASESIIKGMGGKTTNVLLERLTYHKTEHPKIKGLIIAKNARYHNLITSRLGQTFLQAVSKFF
eukprot:403352286